MSGLARKLIDAVQHSLLGALFFRLLPVLWLACLVDSQRGPQAHPVLFSSLVSGVVIATFLAWLIGFLAIHQRPRGRVVPERLQGAPSNGFGAWSERPAGGLRPPRFTRSLVMILGRTGFGRAAWKDWFSWLVWAVLVALFVAGISDGVLLARISPSLAEPPARIALIWCAGVLAVALGVRGWAVDCRKQLMAQAGAPS